MRKFIKDCFTGKDNDTYDLGRILWTATVIVYLFLACYEVVNKKDFKALEYGGGAGLVLGAGAGALWAKSSTEPSENNRQEIK